MAYVKSMLCVLLALLVLPAVACGFFMQQCDCERVTHTTVAFCAHCEHEHEVPVEHNCPHEDYTLQSVSTQVSVPSSPPAEVSAEERRLLIGSVGRESAQVISCLERSRKWVPPDIMALPLLI